PIHGNTCTCGSYCPLERQTLLAVVGAVPCACPRPRVGVRHTAPPAVRSETTPAVKGRLSTFPTLPRGGACQATWPFPWNEYALCRLRQPIIPVILDITPYAVHNGLMPTPSLRSTLPRRTLKQPPQQLLPFLPRHLQNSGHTLNNGRITARLPE